MTVTFEPDLKEMRQIARSCRLAGIPYDQSLLPQPTISCHFTDVTELMRWHAVFVGKFGWAPYDHEAPLTV